MLYSCTNMATVGIEGSMGLAEVDRQFLSLMTENCENNIVMVFCVRC